MSELLVDNFENNTALSDCVSELSDLYECKIPVRIKTPGCVFKSKLIDFASLEHAFMYRMIRFPIVDMIDTGCENALSISAEDAMIFVQQFCFNGVFASWALVSKYCNIQKITPHYKDRHNIGLIARQICSNKQRGKQIRKEIVENARRIWIKQGDKVAKSIAVCLKLGKPNYTSYRAQIRRLFQNKIQNNTHINNVLYHYRHHKIVFSSRNSKIFTHTRQRLDPFYNELIIQTQENVQWRSNSAVILAVYMGLHASLGRDSFFIYLHPDIVSSIFRFIDKHIIFS